MWRFRINGWHQLVLVFCCSLSLFLCSCRETTFQSSVPTYPVRVVIDTKLGPFVHFQPTVMGSYIVVNGDGYFVNGTRVMALGATDMYGYGGVVVYVSMYGYDAYDLACPYCARHGMKRSCSVSGFYAECPECGERYDLVSGYALPTQSISHEALRRLNVINSDGKLTVTQR